MKRVILSLYISLICISSQAQDLRIYPVLWHQTSAEYRALCYQAFNTARSYLETVIATRQPGEKLAIVTDLDETILDNSFMEAQEIKDGKGYAWEDWVKWVNMATATAIPGADDFLRWVAGNDITIFYISNRTDADIPATIANLRKLQIPFADSCHMLFSADGSTKEPRRQKVAQNYKIVMLLGDNLNDFTTAFEDKNVKDRKTEVDLTREEWGRKFIVIPNAVYGEWENVIYDHERGLTPGQKEAKRMGKLIGY